MHEQKQTNKKIANLFPLHTFGFVLGYFDPVRRLRSCDRYSGSKPNAFSYVSHALRMTCDIKLTRGLFSLLFLLLFFSFVGLVSLYGFLFYFNIGFFVSSLVCCTFSISIGYCIGCSDVHMFFFMHWIALAFVFHRYYNYSLCDYVSVRCICLSFCLYVNFLVLFLLLTMAATVATAHFLSFCVRSSPIPPTIRFRKNCQRAGHFK